MHKIVTIFSIIMLLAVVVFATLSSVGHVSRHIGVLEGDKKLSIYDETITQAQFSIETLEYFDQSCDLSNVKGVLDLAFLKNSLPNFCDIVVNEKVEKSFNDIRKKCTAGCNEEGLLYSISLTLNPYVTNYVQICCDNICLQKSLDPICS